MLRATRYPSKERTGATAPRNLGPERPCDRRRDHGIVPTTTPIANEKSTMLSTRPGTHLDVEDASALMSTSGAGLFSESFPVCFTCLRDGCSGDILGSGRTTARHATACTRAHNPTDIKSNNPRGKEGGKEKGEERRKHRRTTVSHEHDIGAKAAVAPVAVVGLDGQLVIGQRLEKLELAVEEARRPSRFRRQGYGT